jgi:serine/threonine protein kinase
LHKYGKIHRSLKPSNVLLANPDQSTPLRTVKLRDYGFNEIKDAILKAGQAPNPYLAPEIYSQPPQQYNHSVDTFAFGMLDFVFLIFLFLFFFLFSCSFVWEDSH